MGKLSPETLAAIDRAARDGVPVQKIPQGQVALDAADSSNYSWRKKSAPGRRPDPEVAARRARVKEMDEKGMSPKEIAAVLGVTPNLVSIDRSVLGLPPARKRSGGDKATEKRAERAEAGAREVADRRRFKIAPVPMGKPGRLAPANAKRTVFPSRVFTPEGPAVEPVLKDGCNNAKIGGDVLVGRLKGAYLCTLTLEERASCPRSCPMWRGCYGNSMQHARRWRHGPELEDSLRIEVAEACEANELVLVRLHVLGDFYSRDYVCLWAELLDDHPGLHAFGFTAWPEDSEIGRAVSVLRGEYPDRFMIRNSGRGGEWGSFTIDYPTEAKTIGDAVVCPEQRDAMAGGRRGKHCGNCAVCWETSRAVAFVEH